MNSTIHTSNLSSSLVRAAYNRGKHGHFFDRSTMAFFGDTIGSFECAVVGDVEYLYRRREARVNVFGKRVTAGHEFFGCWRIESNGKLGYCNQAEKDSVYIALYME